MDAVPMDAVPTEAHPPLTGFTVALTADRRCEEQADLLRWRGATIIHGPTLQTTFREADEEPVADWRLPDDRRSALKMIKSIIDGRVHAITITTVPAVVNLFAMDHDVRRREDLRHALNREVMVVCGDEVCARAAREVGVNDPIVADGSQARPLIRVVTEGLSARRLALGPVVLAGTAVLWGQSRIDLSDTEAALLGALARRPGSVLSKVALVGTVWGVGSDPHVVEVTVARLRRRLGNLAGAIEVVPRRGYRLCLPFLEEAV